MRDTFTLTIELGNDAMRKRRHVASALRDVANAIGQGQADEGRIRDENGNTVGRWEFKVTL
jgi:hypothetical protein